MENRSHPLHPEPHAAPLCEADASAFREVLQRILDSQGFSGSRRLSAFLSFVGDEALNGRTEMDQYVIAEQVLHRSEDFNPLDDASVRKLASQVRHKLEEYHKGEGASDPLIVTLPRRSYLPRFRYRDKMLPATGPEGSGASPDLAGRRGWTIADLRQNRLLGLAGGVAALVLVAIGAYQAGARRAPEVDAGAGALSRETFVINSERGDLRGPTLDVADGAVLLGPPVARRSEVMVRMKFTPEQATQQAGLMIFQSPDQYVRLGNHFKNRTMNEFALEAAGQYHGPEGTYTYDLQGQMGEWRWLSIRRNQEEYTAFLSSDGISWRPFGQPLAMPTPIEAGRVGIYAFNGRSDTPSAVAEFENLGVGISFHHLPDGPLAPDTFGGWTSETACPDAVSQRISDGALEVEYDDSAVGCNWQMVRQPPAGNWTFTALLDFIPVAGSSAGLVVLGTEDSVGMSRRDINNNSIMLQRRDDRDIALPDFPGSPLLYLRLSHRDGVLTGSFSRNGRDFVEFPEQIEVSLLGDLTAIGIVSSIAHWTHRNNRPPARFYHIMRTVEEVEPLLR